MTLQGYYNAWDGSDIPNPWDGVPGPRKGYWEHLVWYSREESDQLEPWQEEDPLDREMNPEDWDAWWKSLLDDVENRRM